MKHFLSVTFLFSVFTCKSLAQWTQQLSPVKSDLKDVAFYSNNVGYAVGAQGTLIRTLNGGKSWKQVTSPDSSDLNSVTILDSLSVMVTTAATFGTGAVFESNDQGKTWHKTLFDTRDFYATSIGRKRLFSISAGVYRSGNGGVKWQQQQPLNSTTIYGGVVFNDAQNGMIAGNVGGILTYSADLLKTTDGSHWYPLDPFSFPNANAYSALTMLDPDHIILVTNFYNKFSPGDSSQIILLTDFNLSKDFVDSSWKFRYRIINPAFNDRVSDCKFFSEGKGFITSKTGVIYRTPTFGKKLIKEYQGKTPLNALCMLNENTGFTVGDGGLILKREEKAKEAPASIITVKLYPNPAVNHTVASFVLNESKPLAIQVSDEQGNMVWLQPEKTFANGNQELSIPVNNLRHGIYQVNILSKGKMMGRSRLLVAH